MPGFPHKFESDVRVEGDVVATSNMFLEVEQDGRKVTGAGLGHLHVKTITGNTQITYEDRGFVLFCLPFSQIELTLPNIADLPTNYVIFRIRNEFGPHSVLIKAQPPNFIGVPSAGVNPFEAHVNADEMVEILAVKESPARWYYASTQFKFHYPEGRRKAPEFGGIAIPNRLYQLDPEESFDMNLLPARECVGSQIAIYAEGTDKTKNVTVKTESGDFLFGSWAKGRVSRATELVIDEPGHYVLLTAGLNNHWIVSGTSDPRWFPSNDQVASARSWTILEPGDTIALPPAADNVGYEIGIQTKRLDAANRGTVTCVQADRLRGFIVDSYIPEVDQDGQPVRSVGFKEADHTIIFTANDQNEWVARSTPAVDAIQWKTVDVALGAKYTAKPGDFCHVGANAEITLPEAGDHVGHEIAVFTPSSEVLSVKVAVGMGSDDCIQGYVVGTTITDDAATTEVGITANGATVIFTANAKHQWIARSTPGVDHWTMGESPDLTAALPGQWITAEGPTTLTLSESARSIGREVTIYTKGATKANPVTIQSAGADKIVGYVVGQIFTDATAVTELAVELAGHTITFTANDKGQWVARSTPAPAALRTKYIYDDDLSGTLFRLQTGYFYSSSIDHAPPVRLVLPPAIDNIGREVTIYTLPRSSVPTITTGTSDGTRDNFEGGYSEPETVGGKSVNVNKRFARDTRDLYLADGRTVTLLADYDSYYSTGFWYVKNIT